MKHYLRFLITMLLLAIWGGGISYGQTWQKVELADLKEGDVFVITGVYSSTTYALPNSYGTSVPKAIKITISEDGKTIEGTVADNLKWTIAKKEDAYVFYPNGNKEKWLYCTKKYNDVRVGTGPKRTFVLHESKTDNYLGLKNVDNDRYVGIYKGQEWRSYTSISGNFKNQQLAYYKYVEDTRTSTNVSFGTDVDGKTFVVNEGEEASFEGKIAAEKDNVAGTIKYSSDNSEIVTVDESTGALTFCKSFGTAKVTASFTPADATKYAESSASYSIKVVDPNAIVFSVADESFENVGGSYDITKENPNVAFVSASGESYTFNLTQCVKATGTRLGCLQMRDGKGVVKSPSFEIFPNGYKVTVYYTVGSKPKNLTITSEELPNATSTTMINGDDYVTTISLPLSTAKFIMTANAAPKYVSKIELTPLAGPATVTLDETSDGISTVISENKGKTVNVTLKRTISKDYLNPVCLPFDLSAEKIAEVFGAGSVVSDYTSVEGTVMNFTPVTTMTANHPYIVQATESFDTKNIAGVTLKTIAEETIAEGEKENIVTFENSNSTFLGSFVGSPSIVVFSKDVEMKLFLGKDGNLYHPTSGSKMKGMRAYFDVTDLTSSEAKVNIGGSLSSIGKLMNGEAITGKVYNLNGQYVGNTLDGLAKGLYIINGKKYIVK